MNERSGWEIPDPVCDAFLRLRAESEALEQQDKKDTLCVHHMYVAKMQVAISHAKVADLLNLRLLRSR